MSQKPTEPLRPDTSLRTTFNEDAERYNRYRPNYPEALFEKLIHATRTTNQSKLLEIGPGTGQATRTLARLDCDITAIELGVGLADVARVNLQHYPNVKVITGSFEEVDLPNSYYDLVYSATAFHWVKDEYKFTKTASILKPKGYLAIIHTEHVAGDDGSKFFTESKSIYGTYLPTKEVAPRSIFTLPDIKDLKAPAIDTDLFTLQSFDTFPVTLTYTAEEYAGLLGTYSPTIALPIEKRKAFLSEIEQLIRDKFDGSLRKRLAFTLATAQKQQ